MSDAGPERRLGPLLLAGMIAMPGVFCWLLLRRGYDPSLRWAAFTYAGVMASIAILGKVAS